jgi:hypothetical protein
MMNDKRLGGKLIGLISGLFVLIFFMLLVYGKIFWWDSVAFKWLWRSVWFVVLPLLLFFSFKYALKGARKHNNDD